MDPMNWHARSWFRRAVIAAGIAIPLIIAMFWMRSENRVLPTTSIATPGGAIVVEIAATPASRSAGLSNREALRGIDGMLLKWDAPGRHPIWMKGMRFPLDVLWLGADDRVIAVLENVPPCFTDPCPLYEPSGSDGSVAVLELPANAAARHGLTVGASVSLPAVPQHR
jgi:uncharacterized membrane protein (UPF0127 family)